MAVAATREPFALRDRGLLESAMAVPMNRWHFGEAKVPVLSASLLLALARNHPFLQGNKRTALLVADAFLTVNGYQLIYPDATLADLILAAIEHKVDDQGFATSFAPACAVVYSQPTRFFRRPAAEKIAYGSRVLRSPKKK